MLNQAYNYALIRGIVAASLPSSMFWQPYDETAMKYHFWKYPLPAKQLIDDVFVTSPGLYYNQKLGFVNLTFLLENLKIYLIAKKGCGGNGIPPKGGETRTGAESADS
jgi:hypothetical protein